MRGVRQDALARFEALVAKTSDCWEWQAANAAKTACPSEHPYEPANTIVDRQGFRRCAVCRREQLARADRKRRKAVAR